MAANVKHVSNFLCLLLFSPRECPGRVGRLPCSACHALIWLPCRAARLSVCRVVLQYSTSPTRTTCCGHSRHSTRESSSDMSKTSDFLVPFSRYPRKDVARMLQGRCEETDSVEFKLDAFVCELLTGWSLSAAVAGWLCYQLGSPFGRVRRSCDDILDIR